jgi:hypothetical protein
MHVVIRRWKVDPSRMDEAVQKIEEEFVPDVSSVEGFVAYYTVKGEGDDALTITICQDREGVEETTRRARAFAERSLGDIVQANSIQAFGGEILVERTTKERRERARV